MNDGSTKESLKKQLAQRAKVKAWLAERPNYQREYATKQKANKRTLGWSSKEGTLPALPRVKGKLAYSITITKPLTKEERYVRQIHKRPSPGQAQPEDEDFRDR